MSKFTPGPWRILPQPDSALLVCSSSLRAIAVCEMSPPDAETENANARLIAAAPDLLAACKVMAKACVAYEVLDPTDFRSLVDRAGLLAAIARAEGPDA